MGFVAVSPFSEPETATIVHVGVLPEQRGNSYIDDLLAKGTSTAQHAGFTKILSDVDTLNFPMLAAMERGGYLSDARPWHVWTHHGDVAAIVAAAGDETR